MVEAFKKRGRLTGSGKGSGRESMMDVTVVEMADHILPTMLDKTMARIVQRELEANGVETILGERVQEILGRDGQVTGIKTNTNRQIK